MYKIFGLRVPDYSNKINMIIEKIIRFIVRSYFD